MMSCNSSQVINAADKCHISKQYLHQIFPVLTHSKTNLINKNLSFLFQQSISYQIYDQSFKEEEQRFQLKNMHQEFISWLLIIIVLTVIIGSICLVVVYFILDIIIDSLIIAFCNTATGVKNDCKNVASELNRIGFQRKTTCR